MLCNLLGQEKELFTEMFQRSVLIKHYCQQLVQQESSIKKVKEKKSHHFWWLDSDCLS